jgi:histidinol-phosphate aminotransferase
MLELHTVHGAIDYAELASRGLSPDDVLDFSVNANPYGPSPAVREAVRCVPLDRYPDRECLQVRQAIQHFELQDGLLPLASILCGNGSNELIWAIASTFLRSGDRVVIIGPTFGEYYVACRAAGATIVSLKSTVETQFQVDSMSISSYLQEVQPRMVWLCNPNNPTGMLLEPEDIFRIARKCMRVGALLVVDEAYRRFVLPGEDSITSELVAKQGELRLIVLRSLTKDYALAGLRLGYLLASPLLVKRLRQRLPAWNVNALAQAAGVAALQDRSYLEQCMQALQDERKDFFAALNTLPVNVVPSRTHFCLLEVGNAREIRSRLLEHKLLVRDCTSFGLPQYIRVATRPASDWQILVQALREVVPAQGVGTSPLNPA